MKNFEKILLFVLIFGMVLKYYEILGGNTIIFISSFVLFCLYLFGGFFILKDFKSGYNNIKASILLGVFYSFEISYLMMVTLHWITTNKFLLIAIMIINFIVVLSIFALNQLEGKSYRRNHLFRVFLILFMLLVMGYINL